MPPAQILEALQLLLEGFNKNKTSAQKDLPGEHIYNGLLTVLLRLIFLLYAEARDLLPAELSRIYNSLIPSERHTAWPRLTRLFRSLHSPPRQTSLAPHGGQLFDPDSFPFLERSFVSDTTLVSVLERLLIVDGRPLDYACLPVEHLGRIYEYLMGYTVELRVHASICLAPASVWLSPHELLQLPQPTRVRWLRHLGLHASSARRLARDLADIERNEPPSLLASAILPLLRRHAMPPGSGWPRVEVPANHLVLSPGTTRRRTSSHYTPPELSTSLISPALAPLFSRLQANDCAPTSGDVLALELCDPAMGCGALLLASCRLLADVLVAAWTRENCLQQQLLLGRRTDPGATVRTWAMRQIARHCLVGVDKHPRAAELCKLSLWLLTRARGFPFSFLDHRLAVGDSLVGLNTDQLLALDWRVSASLGEPQTPEPAHPVIVSLLKQARAIESKPLATPEAGVRTCAPHEGQTANVLQPPLLAIADIILSTYFFPHDDATQPTQTSTKQRKACLIRVRRDLILWLERGGPLPDHLVRRQQWVRQHICPLHWPIVFPNLFAHSNAPSADNAPGVDAVIVNPPFAGKNAITGTHGRAYLAWLKSSYRPSHGNSDLAAYFLRRAAQLVGAHGTVGMLATNTIGQGDTRATGLHPLLASGLQLYAVTQAITWPVAGTNVSVTLIHLAKGAAKQHVTCTLDGRPVTEINSWLRAAKTRPPPRSLPVNRGKSFQGSIVLGKGFLLTPPQRDQLVRDHPGVEVCIAPYLGGHELNNSPTQSHHRYVINFGDAPLETVRANWPALLDIVCTHVKPQRERDKRAMYRRYWWQFAEKRAALYPAIARLPRCLACSSVSKHIIFAFQPTDRVFSHSLIVFPLPRYAHFALLQSRIHGIWARLHGSSMRNDLRYTPSDCFDTFAFPPPHTLSEGTPLDRIGERVYRTRAALLLRHNQGLTKTYNVLTDPREQAADVVELRELHQQLDRAVLGAYNRADIDVPAFSGASEAARDRFENSVLELLFARNAELSQRSG